MCPKELLGTGELGIPCCRQRARKSVAADTTRRPDKLPRDDTNTRTYCSGPIGSMATKRTWQPPTFCRRADVRSDFMVLLVVDSEHPASCAKLLAVLRVTIIVNCLYFR